MGAADGLNPRPGRPQKQAGYIQKRYTGTTAGTQELDRTNDQLRELGRTG